MIDAILEKFREPLGSDFVAYRNHCHRVAHFCDAMTPEVARHPEKTAIAAAFHDLGIWTASTWDYLEPSIALARAHLSQTGRDEWADEIAETIGLHHKVLPIKDSGKVWAEAFRRADLADVSCGLLRSRLAGGEIRSAYREYPDSGFHLRLVQLGCAGALKSPTRPMPMMRW